MDVTEYYLAIDIGASSGRHIVGYLEDGEIKIKEVYRFANGMRELDDSLVWDTEALFREVKRGIKEALRLYPNIKSLAIDTWGVDYVLMNGEKEILPCFAYRDGRTKDDIEAMPVSFGELYKRTGIQFAPYNTIYQLADDNKHGRLDASTDFLMMPEYLNYKLTGVKLKEYTEATTTGLIDAESKQWDYELIDIVGLPERLFGRIGMPSEEVGNLKPEIAEEVGGQIKVVLSASHDTASAVDAIPMSDNDLFLSSGTWSLLGVRLPSPVIDDAGLDSNFSNEGGAGYICYLKNIMGMWIVNELRKELCPDMPFEEIVANAEKSDFIGSIDVSDGAFLAPRSMRAAIDSFVKPDTIGDYFKCVFVGLAECYARAITEIERNTHKRYEKLYIVGGGAKNAYLNELTAKTSGKEVVALPIEATAIGNIKQQINNRG